MAIKTKNKKPLPTNKPAIALIDLLGEVRLRMKKARTFYGLSAAMMSRVCGFGINQWRQYETGKAEPDRGNRHLIDIVCRPRGMMLMLSLCSPLTKEQMGRRWQSVSERVGVAVNKINQEGEKLKERLNDEYFNQ